jgi:hypothetical protein
MVGHGMAQKNVGCLMKLYEDVLQNSLLSCILLFLSQLAWAYFIAVIGWSGASEAIIGWSGASEAINFYILVRFCCCTYT